MWVCLAKYSCVLVPEGVGCQLITLQAVLCVRVSVCLECLVANIFVAHHLSYKSGPPKQDRPCYYRRLSAVVMKLFYKSHKLSLQQTLRAEQKPYTLIKHGHPHVGLLREDSFSELVDLKKSRCFTLTCTVHVNSGRRGGGLQLWEVVCKCVKHFFKNTHKKKQATQRRWETGDIWKERSSHRVCWLHSNFIEKGLLLFTQKKNLPSLLKKNFLRNECNQQRC